MRLRRLILALGVLAAAVSAGKADHVETQGVPDFGQHSTLWCWNAAIADAMWWYSDLGLAGLVPWKDADGSPTISPESLDPAEAQWYDSHCSGLGYPELMEQIARCDGRTYLDAGLMSRALPAFVNARGAASVLEVEIVPSAAQPHVPTTRLYADQLRQPAGGLLMSYTWKDPLTGRVGSHVVAAVSSTWDEPGRTNRIGFADPWTDICRPADSPAPPAYDSADNTSLSDVLAMRFDYGELECFPKYYALLTPRARAGAGCGFLATSDPRGAAPLAPTAETDRPLGPWQWVNGWRQDAAGQPVEYVDNTAGMDLPAGDLWLCHADRCDPASAARVHFDLTLRRDPATPPPSWAGLDGEDLGAGCHDETDLEPTFRNTLFRLTSRDLGSCIEDTIHVAFTVEPQPDWEWIRLLAGAAGGPLELLALRTESTPVPEPAGGLLLALAGAVLLNRRRWHGQG